MKNESVGPEEIKSQQQAEQAVPPSAPPAIGPTMAEIEAKRKESSIDVQEAMIKRENDLLTKLAETDEWDVYKRYVGKMIASLKANLTPSIGKELNLQDVGLKFIISDQIEKALKDALSIVEDRKKLAEIPVENPVETSGEGVSKDDK